MGQRLNIEILDNHEVIANSYYHWSAYTGSAAALAADIVYAFQTSDDALSPVEKAVRLLYNTGARIYPVETARLTDEQRHTFDYAIDENASRNAGLISITQKGIEDTEQWEEYRVQIDITKKEVIFDVFAEYDAGDFEEEFQEPVHRLSVFEMQRRYSFSSWLETVPLILNFITDNQYAVISEDGEVVYAFIE